MNRREREREKERERCESNRFDFGKHTPHRTDRQRQGKKGKRNFLLNKLEVEIHEINVFSLEPVSDIGLLFARFPPRLVDVIRGTVSSGGIKSNVYLLTNSSQIRYLIFFK